VVKWIEVQKIHLHTYTNIYCKLNPLGFLAPMIKLSFDKSSSTQQKDFKKLCKKELLVSFFRLKKEELKQFLHLFVLK
jgi:hypothetical protein